MYITGFKNSPVFDLYKLNQIGVNDTFLHTIRSYINGRKQIVVVDGIKSDTLEIKAGVPQGRSVDYSTGSKLQGKK